MAKTHTLLLVISCIFLSFSQGISDSNDIAIDSIVSTDSQNTLVILEERIEELSSCIIDSLSIKLDNKIDSLSQKITNNQVIIDSLLEFNKTLKNDLEVESKKNRKEISEIKENFTNFNIDRIGIGYEEGLSLRLRLGKTLKPEKKQFLTILGFNYSYKNPSNGMQQKLHDGHVKVGLLREFAVFPKTRISAYVDFIEKFKQIETEPLITNPYTFNKYNMWISTGRAGLMLTVLSLKHFMFSFKFGLEFSYYSPAYINNESNTALMRINNGVFKWGINTGELSILETLINNIGIYVYF